MIFRIAIILSPAYYCVPHSTLLELYTFKAYVNQLNPPKELGRLLEKCIEMSVDSWFSLLKRTVMPTGGVRLWMNIIIIIAVSF